MKNAAWKSVAIAIALSLSMAALVACSAQSGSSGASAGSGAQSASAESGAQDASAQAGQAAAVDTSAWKTLGDAIAFAGDPVNAGWNDDYYVAMFMTDDYAVRVVAKANKDTDEKIMGLMPGTDSYAKELAEAIGDLPIVSAQDVTADRISQDVLDGYVGKTGQALLDDGWNFVNYSMYGGDEMGTSMEIGYFNYNVVFDASIPEEKADKDTEGELIKDAKIKSIECVGGADGAIDPSNI